VIVYFRGEEAVTEEGHYLRTEATRLRGRPAETAVNLGEMRALLADVPGAKLLLVDARRGGNGETSPVARWDGQSPQVGVLHYLWLSGGQMPEEARLVKALEETL